MAETTQAIALFCNTLCGLVVAWLLLSLREATELACWSVLYLDEEARMQRTAIRIQAVSPVERRLVVWMAGSDRKRLFRISKIVEARDMSTGMPVDVEKWVESFSLDKPEPRGLRMSLGRSPIVEPARSRPLNSTRRSRVPAGIWRTIGAAGRAQLTLRTTQVSG